jgi:hypothetical protein
MKCSMTSKTGKKHTTLVEKRARQTPVPSTKLLNKHRDSSKFIYSVKW